MKVHYINILLFALPLNIFVTLCHVNTHKKPSITPCHTHNNRSLCECDLYIPNYDSDPQMKKVMDNFNKHTQQRFHEYDDRMIEKRKQCKDKCDKEIQKIILKDKLEKQMEQQFTILETKIGTDDIPTCICEKSLADKTEKFCLNCGMNVGGVVTLSSGVLGGIGEAAISTWKFAALKVAIEEVTAKGAAEGAAAGIEAGKRVVIFGLKNFGIEELIPGICESFLKRSHYNEVMELAGAIIKRHGEICSISSTSNETMCTNVGLKIGTHKAINDPYGLPRPQAVSNALGKILDKAETTAANVTKTTTDNVTAQLTTEKTGEIAATCMSYEITIIASIVAIVVIVLIMVIIYLILRYRRNKKMKKKLQYIKLLKE
ncbi:rifin PIR protein, putative [Plasmodium reichenowi]|uniref:Rifin PIR protein, putative n=1 Tax=Plasmodium reichenowi TaxID=5854 RepID=A0A2P9DSF8_PLARE|nr:rifin PIR protein, putative [Plasmodium reichenowi]